MEPQNHLFTIWLTNKDWDAMPFLDEICVASAQVMNNKPVTIYTNHELHLSFLDRKITNIVKLDNSILEKAEQICGQNKAHQSDYIRLWLLQEKGGVYFDTDILFYDSFSKIWNTMIQSKKSVLYLREDKNMICNCCIMSTGNNNTFFEDMFWYYNNRFIKHSYLFNSQKIMNLMSRKHKNLLNIYQEPSLFEIPWNDVHNIFLMEPRQKGIGQHLYSSIRNWDTCRKYLDDNCFGGFDESCFPTQLTNYVIGEYIKMMKEADNNAD